MGVRSWELGEQRSKWPSYPSIPSFGEDSLEGSLERGIVACGAGF